MTKYQLENQMVRAIPFEEASENMGCDLRRCIFFLLFLVCSADLDIL